MRGIVIGRNQEKDKGLSYGQTVEVLDTPHMDGDISVIPDGEDRTVKINAAAIMMSYNHYKYPDFHKQVAKVKKLKL